MCRVILNAVLLFFLAANIVANTATGLISTNDLLVIVRFYQ